MLSPADLQAFIERGGIAAEIIWPAAPTPTVETAAAAVGARPEQIVKSVLFLIAGKPLLAIVCGLRRVDDRRLARHFAVGRKQVRLADGATVLTHTGYPAGAVPPFGHVAPLSTVLDPLVLAQALVFAGGGSDRTLLRVTPAEIARVTQAEILAVLEDDHN